MHAILVSFFHVPEKSAAIHNGKMVENNNYKNRGGCHLPHTAPGSQTVDQSTHGIRIVHFLVVIVLSSLDRDSSSVLNDIAMMGPHTKAIEPEENKKKR